MQTNQQRGRREGLSSQLLRGGLWAQRSIVQNERTFFVLTLCLFEIAVVVRAWYAPLWFDEFFTLFISRLPSFPEMLKAMPADGQPPLQYLVTAAFLHVPGELEFALRLPELLAYSLSGVLTYKIVRKHAEAPASLLAMSVLLGSGVVQQQASTARPYALLLAFTALAFACWQAAIGRVHHRLLPLIGLTISIIGAVTTHHFGAIYVGTFLATGEGVRFFERRRLDPWILGAVTVGLLPLTFTASLAHKSRVLLGDAVAHSSVFWAKPTTRELLVYGDLIPVLLVALVLLAMAICWFGQSEASDDFVVTSAVPASQCAAAVALSLLLPIMLLLAAVNTGYFVSRYAIGTSFGLALVCGWLVPNGGRLRKIGSPAISIGVLSYLTFFIGYTALLIAVFPPWHVPEGRGAISPLLREASGTLPVVMANAEDFAREWWYAPPQWKARITYLVDVSYAVKQPGFLAELSLAADRKYIPLPLSDSASFLSNHKEFLLLASGKEQYIWLPKRLKDDGWILSQIGRSGSDVLYDVHLPTSR